jgi:glycosyltransferase involved in cell wall biosynthesis
MTDEVSVVIPAYNAAAFVGEAIECVLGQTEPPTETIVVDDASTDGTLEIVAAYGSVRCVRLFVNRGQAAALNRGIAESRGKYLAFLDADDLWRSHKLASQLAAFDADPSLDLVYGLAEERVTGVAGSPGTRNGRVLPAYLPSALLARRAALERVGGFDESFRIGSVIDWYSRALAAGLRIALLPEVVYERRIHGRNTGLVRRDARDDYLAVVQMALSRRRRAE